IGPKLPEPDLPVTQFASRQAWQQETVRQATEQTRKAVSRTLDRLKALGLDPQGWELGQAVVHGPPAGIRQALELKGIKFAVLNWELGMLDSLPGPPAEPSAAGQPAQWSTRARRSMGAHTPAVLPASQERLGQILAASFPDGSVVVQDVLFD